jgi:hypothetical protein
VVTKREYENRSWCSTYPYLTRNQIQNEKKNLEVAEQIDAVKDLYDLKVLLRDGKIKEFYELENRLMRINL